MKFDWIDFGASWKEPTKEPFPVDLLLHKSTASLLSKFLRRRDTPFRKVFCWLRQEPGVLEQSDTPRVRHIEASFPFTNYVAVAETERLSIFADWLVSALALGAPELGIEPFECEALRRQLSAQHFTYIRAEKLKRVVGQPKCEIVYKHTPTDLTILATCKLPDGKTITRSVRDHAFRRDELVYGRAISRCVVNEGGDLALHSDLGVL